MARWRRPLDYRFWKKVNKDGPVPVQRPELGPCWTWTGVRNKAGYGHMIEGGDSKRMLSAHRVAWELLVGPLPERVGHHGMCVLHHCDNTSCVKAVADANGPAHLFLGSHLDNMVDKVHKGRARNLLAERNSAKTHCPQGHAYEGDNVIRRRGSRECRACAKVSQQRRKAAT